jgi:hypothetical protein
VNVGVDGVNFRENFRENFKEKFRVNFGVNFGMNFRVNVGVNFVMNFGVNSIRCAMTPPAQGLSTAQLHKLSQNHPKIVPKSSQNHSKINPKSPQWPRRRENMHRKVRVRRQNQFPLSGSPVFGQKLQVLKQQLGWNKMS